MILVDAHTGEPFLESDDVKRGWVTATGESIYSGTVSIPAYLAPSGPTYYMESSVDMSCDLSAYREKLIRLAFETTANATLETDFRIDAVSLKMKR